MAKEGPFETGGLKQKLGESSYIGCKRSIELYISVVVGLQVMSISWNLLPAELLGDPVHAWTVFSIDYMMGKLY